MAKAMAEEVQLWQLWQLWQRWRKKVVKTKEATIPASMSFNLQI
jgi:hypothetical protein